MLKEYVFHSHTFRCGHATNDIEDYVTEAIKLGYKKYGVSDHVFLPGVICPGVRGDYSLLGEYINEFKRCKALYGNQIEMYLGFECEWSIYYKKVDPVISSPDLAYFKQKYIKPRKKV